MNSITEFLKSIEEREKKATKADWIHCNRAEGKIILCKTVEESRRELVMRYGRQTVDLCAVHPADAEFIAHAPEDMRALLAIVRKYREALEHITKSKEASGQDTGRLTYAILRARTALDFDPREEDSIALAKRA